MQSTILASKETLLNVGMIIETSLFFNGNKYSSI